MRYDKFIYCGSIYHDDMKRIIYLVGLYILRNLIEITNRQINYSFRN